MPSERLYRHSLHIPFEFCFNFLFYQSATRSTGFQNTLIAVTATLFYTRPDLKLLHVPFAMNPVGRVRDTCCTYDAN